MRCLTLLNLNGLIIPYSSGNHLTFLAYFQLWNPCPTLKKEETTSKTTCSKSVKVEIEEEETVRRKLEPLTIT